jgi:hypothetical protein
VASYGALLDGLIVDAADPDPAPEGIRALSAPTLMNDPGARREVATRTLEFAAELGGG